MTRWTTTYDQVQREHSVQAFEKNVAPPARPTLVHDGDRLRLQTGLYDNKLVADYINRVGQRLVPADSDKLFAFRLVAHPIPFAETLSTGTIYVSTGLLSLLDNEAQLAYVLAPRDGARAARSLEAEVDADAGQDDFNRKEGTKRQMLGLRARRGSRRGGWTASPAGTRRPSRSWESSARWSGLPSAARGPAR